MEDDALLGSIVIPNGPSFSSISDDVIAQVSIQFAYCRPEDPHTPSLIFVFLKGVDPFIDIKLAGIRVFIRS